jgi:hypothetical protein
MRATPEAVLRQVRAVIGTRGNEHSNAVVARLLLRRLLFDGNAVPSWHHEAACAGMPAETFHPPAADRPAVEAAKLICQGCPVRVECLADILAWELPSRRSGILGGLTPGDRDRLVDTQGQREREGGAAA